MNLEFQDIHYSIKSLHILKGVSGRIEAGRFFAFLGKSGSGKSTLLDVIAKRKRVGEWSGSIKVNGAPVVAGGAWRRMCGYVLQHDRLLSTATVFETLMFSVQLRTKYGTTHEDHVKKVHDVLEELSLSHRKDSRIGSESAKSLSGGEIRRVSIGIELVADVRILLLDEPTSGLDSTTARAIVQTLKDLAKSKSRIVAATIHQPSSSITALFDDMMLLANGQVCYVGPWSRAVGHFATLGFECPMYVNPTDYFMDLTGEVESEALMVKNAYTYFDEVDHSKSDSQGNPSEPESVEEVINEGYLTPFWYQFKVLWVRSLKQWYRNELMLVSEIIQYIFCGLFIGIMYHSFSDDFSATSGVFDRISAVFFILTTVCFIPSFTVVTLSAEDRPLFKKEVASGMYRPTASFLAKQLTTWPFEVFLGLLFSLCCYFLCGFQSDFEHFVIFFLIVTLFLFVSETIGLFCSTATPNPTIGVLILSIILLVCLALGGFLVSTPKPYYDWFEKVNFFVFAYTAMTLNEFDGMTIEMDGASMGAVDYLRSIGRLRNDFSIWANVGLIVVWIVVLRLLTISLLMHTLYSSSFKEKESPTKAAVRVEVEVEGDRSVRQS